MIGQPTKRYFILWLFIWPFVACQLSFLDDPPPTIIRPESLAATNVPATPLPAITSEPLTTPPPTAVVPPAPTPIVLEQTTPLLGPNIGYSGQLTNNDAAVYQLQLPAESDLILVIRPQEGLDAVLQVSDDQALLVDQVDDYGANEPEFLRLNTTAAADYTVRVTGFEGSSGNYTINLYDLNSSTTTFLLNITDSVAAGDVNSYTIDQVANQFVIVFFDPTDFDGLVEIYEPSGFLLSKDEGQTGEAETAVFTPRSDGEHLIRIFGYLGDSGSYALRVIALP